MSFKEWFSDQESVLTLHESLTLSDVHNRSWSLLKLAHMPENEWPAAPWDVRISLELHQTLCIPSVSGLTKRDYPVYWQGVFQQAFPDEHWVLSPATIDQTGSTLITAMPQRVNDALQPFQSKIRWCRPNWAPVLESIEPLLTVRQHASLVTWIFWEGSKVLWLQRHNALSAGWKKAVIRAAPFTSEERQAWLSTMLASECSTNNESSPVVCIVDMQNGPLDIEHLKVSEENLKGWNVLRLFQPRQG